MARRARYDDYNFYGYLRHDDIFAVMGGLIDYASLVRCPLCLAAALLLPAV